MAAGTLAGYVLLCKCEGDLPQLVSEERVYKTINLSFIYEGEHTHLFRTAENFENRLTHLTYCCLRLRDLGGGDWRCVVVFSIHRFAEDARAEDGIIFLKPA